MQLVRVIETGVDIDPIAGNGFDLNPSLIYHLGISMGGKIGAPFLAVEPDVTAGFLGVMGAKSTPVGSGVAGRLILPAFRSRPFLTSDIRHSSTARGSRASTG